MDLGTRFFVQTSRCLALHGRHFGAKSGVPIVLLHASPMSSKALVPLAHALVQADPGLCVVALDTPGFGFSTPLSVKSAPLTLADFAEAFWEALAKLGINKTAIYGSATGAQIAIEMATRKPQKITLLIADGACHFEPEQRADILANYFPSLAPVTSGAHLTQAALMARKLFEFFPWYETRQANKLACKIPNNDVLHELARAYLSARPSYDTAYRLAFTNERAEQVAKLRVNTWITRWPDSILLPHTDALLNQLPAQTQVLNLQPGATRYDEIAQHCALQLMGANRAKFKLPLHNGFLVINLAIGSLIISRQVSDANSFRLAGANFHLPGLGLGEQAGDVNPELNDWKFSNEEFIDSYLDDSFGDTTVRLNALASVHAALDQQPALMVLPENAELLQTWSSLSMSESAGFELNARQAKLNAVLDLARLKARLLENAM